MASEPKAQAPAAPPFTGKLSPEVRRSLGRASDYLWQNTGPGGELICPHHRIDHTGRSARSIVIDCALHAATGSADYFARAQSRALTVAGKLVQDPAHGGWIYFPGRLNPANNSNNVIDGGEATDALATFLLQFGDAVSADVRQRLIDAIGRNCDTYLRDAAVTKEVTNQRVWGAMGLAAAYRLTGEPAWKQAALDSVARSMPEQNPDGSFPYHPSPDRYGIHPGAGGASVYYQSRVLAFAAYALALCDELGSFRDALGCGLDFLRDATTPQGYKPLKLDSKPWFWAGPVEAGSHPYDVYALAALGEPDGVRDEIRAKCARLLETQDDDGAFRGVPAGPRGFLCRHFHTADVAWLARAAELAEVIPQYAAFGGFLPKTAPRAYPQAGLIRLQRPDSCALVAVPPEPRNLLWGARAGHGEVVYLGRRAQAWVNEVGGWHGRSSGWSAPARLTPLESARRYLGAYAPVPDLRFRLHIARNAWRGGNRLAAALAVFVDAVAALRQVFQPAFRSGDWRGWQVELAGEAVTVLGGLAAFDGAPLDGVNLRKTLLLEPQGLRVVEELEVRASSRLFAFTPPPEAGTLDCSSNWTHRIRHGRIEFEPGDLPAKMRIAYTL